jgi:DNA replication and repair protein RecF
LPLRRLRVSSLRCLKEVELALDPSRNYFFGANGAGKTSLLEAVFFLGRGRSFRTRQARTLVSYGEPGLAVYGDVEDGVRVRRIGAAYRDNRLERRVDGDPASGSMVAEILAVQTIGPDSHRLIEGGPSERRRFLDWGVFHVEHSYLDAWQRYRRVLGQRNAALLRHAETASELRVWTEALAEAGAEIDRSRKAYVARLTESFARHASELLGQALSLEYRSGWRSGLSLAEALEASTARDRALGHTEPGPHRADLAVHAAGRRVQDEASRGQQKLVAAALVLAQESVLAATAGTRSVLLVDDPAAELDSAAFDRFLQQLATVRSQLLFTGLAPLAVSDKSRQIAMFHVERGHVAGL